MASGQQHHLTAKQPPEKWGFGGVRNVLENPIMCQKCEGTAKF